MKKGIVKTLKTILNVAMVVVILISALVTVISLNTKEKGVSDIGGLIPFSIQTESMQDTINKGDLIITNRYESQTLKKGDIISFFATEQDTTVIKTHRIVEVKVTGDITSYVTKGDNNKYADDKEVAPGDIVAVYDGTILRNVGTILDFFKSKYGFLFCIILPIFIFFIYQLYTFIILVMDVKKEKIMEEMRQMSEKA